jgi:putative nucleotidyltransferase with HDIG domain
MFGQELNHLSNNEIIGFTQIVLSQAPKKFYTMPASSGGKYHPATSLGQGGLVTHTKQVFYMAMSLMDTRLPMFKCDRDIVLSACLLHDIYKYDTNPENKWTLRNHGLKAKEWIEQLDAVEDYFACYQTKPDWYFEILKCIQSHNGVFSREYQGKFDTNQSIVHAADYLASRKWNLFDKGKL